MNFFHFVEAKIIPSGSYEQLPCNTQGGKREGEMEKEQEKARGKIVKLNENC